MKPLHVFGWFVLLFAACDTAQLYHQVTIVNGSGTGAYELGQQVAIQADPAPEGMAFLTWTGDTAVLSAPRAPSLSFSMPFSDVTLEAIYADLPLFSLTVENGTGSGQYIEGTVVAIEADPAPDYHLFEKWTGDVAYLADEMASATQLTMPAQAITLSGSYVLSPDLVSFSAEIMPIFELKCNTSGCHDPLANNEPLTDYDEVKNNLLDIQIMVLNGTMPPPPDVLPQAEKELILLWIEQGAPNN